jgi:hypothetical protein
MDAARLDLIIQLCTRIGMIMEDSSAIALTAGGGEECDLHNTLDHLERAAASIKALTDAASVLARPT